MRLSTFAAAALVCVSLVACKAAKSPEGAQAAPETGAVSGRIEGTAPAPNARPTVAYVEGQVARGFEGAWTEVRASDEFADGESLRTGPDGYCELDFGGKATLRVKPDSVVVVTEAALGPDGATVRLALLAGSVYSKVDKLLGSDVYNVSTARGVAGVRGTEFVVAVGKDGRTTVSVREGRVSVVPRSKSVDRLLELAKSDLVARVAAETVLALAPVVEPDQELSLGDDSAAAAETAAAPVLAEVEAGEPVPPDPDDRYAATVPAEPRREALPAKAAARAEKVRKSAAERFLKAAAVPAKAGSAARDEWKRFDDRRKKASGAIERPEAKPKDPAAPGASDGGPGAAPADEALGRRVKRFAVSERPVAGFVVTLPENPPEIPEKLYVCVDGSGSVIAFAAGGAVRWSVPTANKGGPLSHPVPFRDKLFFSGAGELVVIAGASGEVLARRTLDEARSHAGGARVAPFPNGLLFPTADGIEFLDPNDASVIRKIPVADGVGMTPSNYQGMAAIVNNEGVFLLVDMANGKVVKEIRTNARLPVALAPRIFEDKAVFADRRGLVVLVDLVEGIVLWERKAPDGVFTDIEINREGVFIFGKTTISGYRLDGSAVMEIFRGVSAPPLLSRGMLYFGTTAKAFIIAETNPWRIARRIPLDDLVTTRPILGDGCVYVGTKSGKILKIPLD